MNTHLINACLTLFNAVPTSVEVEEKEGYFHKDYGLFVSPSACYAKDAILQWASTNLITNTQLNSTLHKSWNKVENAPIEQLFTEQLLHYFSTYGMKSLGLTPFNWTPPEELEIPDEKFSVFVVGTLSQQELTQRSLNLLNSVALKQETITLLFDLLDGLGVNWLNVEVANREAQCFIADRTGILPRKPDDLFRYFVYKATDLTLVINNKETWEKIANSGYELPKLSREQKIGLASCYNRHDRLWVLGFKKSSPNNRTVVNQISRFSKKHHKPMTPDVLGNLTGIAISLNELQKVAEKASLFKLIKAANGISQYLSTTSRFYQIRNGKSWCQVKPLSPSVFLVERYHILREAILSKLPKIKIYQPPGIDYAVPTSEKQMCGNFPQGSRISCVNNDLFTLLVGITWSENDLDLSAIGLDGTKVGWNARYRTEELLYSGDITGGEYCAEWLYGKSISQPYLLTANLFSGEPLNPKVSLALSSKEDNFHNYIVTSDELVGSFPLVFSEGTNQCLIGFLTQEDGLACLYLYNVGMGSKRVSEDNESSQILRNNLLYSTQSQLRLSNLFETVNTPEEADVDLSPDKLTKSTILELFQ